MLKRHQGSRCLHSQLISPGAGTESLPHATLLASALDLRLPRSRLEVRLQLQMTCVAQESKGDTGEAMSAVQISTVRYAVIRLSSAKDSPERLVLAYPNEETLRGLIADTSIVGFGFSSPDEAVSTAESAMTRAVAPRQADGFASIHIQAAQVDHLREQRDHGVSLSPIRRLAASVFHLSTAAAIFIFYSKNIVSATLRAVLAGSL